ncbi:hypothetical protein [Pseudolabrys taiwanensis]|nr:hypothetical protein [Pseudolabrys taiwanensis]
MKKLLLSAAVAAVLATPAFAQSYSPDFGTGNINPPVASLQSNEAGSAFAYAPRVHGRMMRDPNAVYSYGQYRGSDPSPYVREELRRDYPQN